MGFTKATGVDMIVAHRLLKNDVPAREHILVTEAGVEKLGAPDKSNKLKWEMESSEYDGVGEVRYHFASLEPLLELVPSVPPRPNDVKRLGENSFSVEIDRSMTEVYRTLLDLDTRDEWIPSVLEVEGGPGVPRRGFTHVCRFEGLTVELETVGGEVGESEIIYVEQGWIKELGMAIRDTFSLRSLGPNRTKVVLEIHWPASDELPDGVRAGMLQSMGEEVRLLKQFCERSE